jgi:glutamate-ammonia-ligase adenylyltransferase
MGSLGARALTATSDLDLIVIYDPAEVEASEGRRPLASRAYYARLTQAFVTALTAPLGDGRLYEVDMRLRPSGRQGPVATSLESFRNYQSEEAWTWEHLALTRARCVAGDAGLGEEIEAFRAALLARPRDKAATLQDVAEMRARLAAAKPAHGRWDPKSGPGRLQDIALLAQAGTLLAGEACRRVDAQLRAGQAALALSDGDCGTLLAAQTLLWQLQSAARLMTEGALDTEAVGAGGRAFLLRETGLEDMAALEAAVEDRTAAAARIVGRVLEADGDGTEGADG